MKFTIYDLRTGQVLYGGNCPDPGLLVQVGQALLEGSTHASGWIQDGAHHEVPPCPSKAHKFNWEAKEWRDDRTIKELKDAKWEALKIDRDKASFKRQIKTPYGTVQGSEASVDAVLRTISKLREMQALGMQIEPEEWTMEDDSVVPLSLAQLGEIAVSMLSPGNNAHKRGRQLRALLYSDSIVTPEQIKAIVWETDV